MKRDISQRKRRKPHLRIGDSVQVISGKDKGNVGKILEIDWKREKVVVEGVNLVKRHVKPNQQNQQGGIFTSEAPIHYSNVLMHNSNLGKGVRIRCEKAENGIKNRVCVKTSTVLE